MRTVAVVLILALAGCKTAPEVKVPEVVKVTVREYVPVPDELTQQVPVYEVAEQTYGEAVKAANLRKAGQIQCNAQLEAISELKP